VIKFLLIFLGLLFVAVLGLLLLILALERNSSKREKTLIIEELSKNGSKLISIDDHRINVPKNMTEIVSQIFVPWSWKNTYFKKITYENRAQDNCHRLALFSSDLIGIISVEIVNEEDLLGRT